MKDFDNEILKLDKIIDNYTVLLKNSNYSGVKKSYEIILNALINQKVKIQQIKYDIEAKEEICSKQS